MAKRSDGSQGSIRRWLFGFAVAAGVGLGAAACEPIELDLVVDSGADLPDASPLDGVCATAIDTCTLRAALTEANGNVGLDRITIDPAVGTVTLDLPGAADDANVGGDLDVTDDLRLVGNDTVITQTVVDGVVQVLSGDVRLTGVTLSGGDRRTEPDGRGGGLAVGGGQVTLASSTVEANWAVRGGGVAVTGGALVVSSSTVQANVAVGSSAAGTEAGRGGGLHVSEGTLVVDRSTVSGNVGVASLTSLESSGGIGVDGGSTTVLNSTVADNLWGAAIGRGGGTIDVRTSTLTTPEEDRNLILGSAGVHVSGSLLVGGRCDGWVDSGGWNLGDSVGCVGPYEPTDQAAQAPLIAPFDGQSHRPYDNSPLLDAIPQGTPGLCDAGNVVDQHDALRGAGGTPCDIGAVEGGNGSSLSSLSFVVDTNLDANDANVGDGLCATAAGTCSIRAAVSETNARPTHDTITIAPGISPQFSLGPSAEPVPNANGDLDVRSHLTIDGDGAILRAAGLDIAFDVHETRLEVNDLQVRSTAGGSIRSLRSAVVLTASTIEGNNSGTTLSASASKVSIVNSTINGTASTTDSSRILDLGGAAFIDRSLVVDNHGSVGGSGTLTLRASVIDGGNRPACDTSVLAVTSSGYNADNDGSCLGAPAAGDLPGQAPALNALAENGGPTATRMPFAGSATLDQIPVGTPELCDGGAADQRGVPRPVGAACDIGPVEGSSAGPVQPLSLTVNTALDLEDIDPGNGICGTGQGVCSVRAAVQEANAWPTPDTITFAPGVDPVLSLSVCWAGPYCPALTVYDDLTVLGGGASLGGGFRLHAGDLVIRDLVMGGTRQHGGELTLERVTSVSQAVFTQTAGDALVVDSTLAAIESDVDDLHVMIQVGGSATILRSTIVADRRFDVTQSHVFAGNPVTLGASIVDNLGDACAAGVDVVSLGYNWFDDASCSAVPGVGDQVAAGSALLSVLADNGGPTPTLLPAANSGVLDGVPAGTAGLCDASTPTDQRGAGRPAGGACDIGSVEGAGGAPIDPLVFTVTSAADGVDASLGDGVCATATATCTLRAAIGEANSWPTVDTVTIAGGVHPTLTIGGSVGTSSTSEGDLDVVDDLVLDGNGAVVTAANNDRVLYVAPDAALTIQQVQVSGGVRPAWHCCTDPPPPDEVRSGSGGGIFAHGDLTVIDSIVSGNTSNDGNGGGSWASGDLTVIDSIVSGNTSSDGSGGGIWAASLSLERATVSGNEAWLGGGVYATAGTVVDSTFTANEAWFLGGGLDLVGGTVTNSTFSGNSSPRAAAVRVHGTGTLRFVTVAGNSGGAAVQRTGAGVVTVVASVLADTLSCTGALTSGGWNWTVDAACPFAAAGDVEAPGGDALLGPLADNGGPTSTMLPGAGSPLIDAIPWGTAGVCDGTVPTDQRGVARPAGQPCTKGSVEL